jgi:hypothetical protein
MNIPVYIALDNPINMIPFFLLALDPVQHFQEFFHSGVVVLRGVTINRSRVVGEARTNEWCQGDGQWREVIFM